MAEEWNEHIMSKSISEGLPRRPDTMYFLPHLHNCQDCSDPLEENHTDTFSQRLMRFHPIIKWSLVN